MGLVNYVARELVVFRVVDTGETVQITDSAPAKTHMKNDEVLIVVDDEERRIWIWKGSEAPVRRKFIAARRASGIRDQRGLTYKIISEDHGSESEVFLEAMGAPPSTKADAATGSPTAPPTPPPGMQPDYPTPRSHAPPPQPADTDYTRVVVSATRTPERHPVRVPHPPSEIIEQVEQLEPVPGFRREFVLIGFDAFGEIEERTKLLGKHTITKKLQRIDSLPEGTIFAQGYTPRVVIKDGQVLAIEFLKQLEEEEYQHERPKTKEDMQREISELIHGAQSKAEKSSETKSK